MLKSATARGIWYWGASGAGKSHHAFKDYSPETHYIHNSRTIWWDNYKQQDTVIIDNFSGEILFNDLLELFDDFPYSVPRRNKSNIQFTSKKVIIASLHHPSKVYPYVGAGGIEMLARYFDIIELMRK